MLPFLVCVFDSVLSTVYSKLSLELHTITHPCLPNLILDASSHMMAVIVVSWIIYGFMFVVGLPTNGFLLWVNYKSSKKRRLRILSLKRQTATDVLLLNLAMIDFVACLLAPLTIAFSYIQNHDWICKFTIFTSRTTSLAGLLVTVSIALCRYSAVVRRGDCSWGIRFTWFVSASCAVLAILANVVFLVHSKLAQVHPRQPAVCVPLGSKRGSLGVYKWTLSALFFLCFLTVFGVYCRILRETSRKRNVIVRPDSNKDRSPDRSYKTERNLERYDVVQKNKPDVRKTLSNLITSRKMLSTSTDNDSSISEKTMNRNIPISSQFDSSTVTGAKQVFSPPFIRRKSIRCNIEVQVDTPSTSDVNAAIQAGMRNVSTSAPIASNAVPSVSLNVAEDTVTWMAETSLSHDGRKTQATFSGAFYYSCDGANRSDGQNDTLRDVFMKRARAARRRRIRLYQRTTRTVLVITIMTFLAWFPYIIIPLSPVFANHLLQVDVKLVFFLFRLRDLNHATNLFVYLASNYRFRQTCREFLVRSSLGVRLKSIGSFGK